MRNDLPLFGQLCRSFRIASSSERMLNLTLFYMLILVALFWQQHIVTAYKAAECDKMREPKMLRSCCKIPRTDEVIKKCRTDLLNEKINTNAKYLQMDKLARNICIAECEFKAKSYLNAPNALNFKAVEADLRKRHPKDLDYVQLLLKGFHKCADFARNKTQEFSWLKSTHDCNFFAATLLACATEEVYENCPKQKWHATPECEKMRNFLVKCDELKKN